MKQIIILSVLIVSTFGAKLNQYLPPRPETHNIQFQPPALPNTGNLPEQPIQPPNVGGTSQQRFTPKAPEQLGHSSSIGSHYQQTSPTTGNNQGPVSSSGPFGQFKANVYGAPEQPSAQFGHFSQKSSPKLNGNDNTNQASSPIVNSYQKNAIPQQFSNSFGQFPQSNSNKGTPSRQYLTPNNKDSSGQNSNSIGQFQSPNFGSNAYNQRPSYNGPTDNINDFNQPAGSFSKSNGQYPGAQGNFGSKSASFGTPFTPDSFGQSPNQIPSYNGPSANGNDFNQESGPFGKSSGQYSGAQGTFGNQAAPIGLIRSEFNPDAGDGHYKYLYETENGITAQEEGVETNNGKSALGGFSYTSPEGEQITLEYTADANGFVPKGSHVPEIPEAIAKSIELNKAAEARGEYNEGSYREEFNDESSGNGDYQRYSGYQGNEPRGQSSVDFQGNNKRIPFNTFQPSTHSGNQNNGYQNYGSSRPSSFPGQGTFASQENKQLTPFAQQNNGAKHSFGQNNGYQYSAPGKTNFPDQGTFASQQNKQVTPFEEQSPKSVSINANHGHQFPASEPNSFAGQQNKHFASQAPTQFAPRPQYETSGQYGTVQDDQGGYKY